MTTRERNARGQFIRGTAAGPGRPRRDSGRLLREIVATTCSVADWKVITSKAVELARGGDAAARDWLTSLLAIDAPGRPGVAQVAADGDLPAREPEAAARPDSGDGEEQERFQYLQRLAGQIHTLATPNSDRRVDRTG